MNFDNRRNPQVKHINELKFNDGMYHNDLDQLKEILHLYSSSFASTDTLACFPRLCVNEQQHYLNKYKHIDVIHNRSLESFYTQSNRWTKCLKGRRVLVATSMTDSIQHQLDNKNLPTDIWHPETNFIMYRTYNTLANNHTHSSCLETLDIMKQEISDIEFDVALLSCGGYGMPLCDHIKRVMNRSAIYIGGCMQLLFGVLGARWVNSEPAKTILNGYKNFIRPLESDRIENYERVEQGCYW